MKSPPVATFIVGQTEFRFEFFVVALNHPAMFADADQACQAGFPRQIRQPVSARLLGSDGPLDQQPLFRLAESLCGRLRTRVEPAMRQSENATFPYSLRAMPLLATLVPATPAPVAFTVIGWCVWSRRIRLACLPFPSEGLGGKGCRSSAHTVVLDLTASE